MSINRRLRTKRDYYSRKKMNDGKGWTSRMLDELKSGIENDNEGKAPRGRKGKRETARRLTKNSL